MARNKLMDLWMQDAKYNKYMAKFKGLSRRASYTQGNEETFNMFLRGLPEKLIHNAIKPPLPANYQELKEQVKQLAQVKALLKGILRKRGMNDAYQHINNQLHRPFFAQGSQGNWQNN
jgi:hypothetical protein